MKLENYSWAGTDLLAEAGKYTQELWERRYAFEAVFFIPMEAFNRDGVYGLPEEAYHHLVRDRRGYSFKDPDRPDPGFMEFMREIRLITTEPRETLRSAIAYALAHGMDIVPGNIGQAGTSAITGLTHWTLHNDIYDA